MKLTHPFWRPPLVAAAVQKRASFRRAVRFDIYGKTDTVLLSEMLRVSMNKLNCPFLSMSLLTPPSMSSLCIFLYRLIRTVIAIIIILRESYWDNDAKFTRFAEFFIWYKLFAFTRSKLSKKYWSPYNLRRLMRIAFDEGEHWKRVFW